jgi:hypothetical protein
MDDRDKLERTIEMLRYSIDNTMNQLSFYNPEDLEYLYAQKILDSCRVSLAEKEKELAELDKKKG